MAISAPRAGFYIAAALVCLAVVSFIASAIFFSWLGLETEHLRPWSIWLYIETLNIPSLRIKFLLSLFAPCVPVLALAAAAMNKQEPEYGDAHWASGQEIRQAGLFSKEGIILGKFKSQYLISNTPTHVMLIAPTRSGKGVGIVTPNLLNWRDSLICLDIKNENFKNTAGFREKHGQKVFMWSPLDPEGHSHRYNPLDAVSRDPYQKVSDIQVIARILIKDPPKSDPVWSSEARALFVGLALYVMENDEMPSTIGSINRMLGTEQDLGDVVRHIIQQHPELSDTIKKSLMNFANKAAKERSGVKSSLNQAINLWDNPVIDAATSASDFSLKDLRRQRISIYVGVLTGQIATLAPLLRIFFEQVITTMAMHEPGDDEPCKVMLMLDEFHMLGDLSTITSAFTLLGGYNCRVLAVVQGLKWLDDVYGRDKRDGILSCCAHQIFFAANDLETATYISSSCGERTVKTVSTSKKNSMKYEPVSRNISSRARPLISKEKAKQIPKSEQIIITEASPPIRASKIRYFEDRNFKNRLIAPPALPKLRIINYGIPKFDIDGAASTNSPYGTSSQKRAAETCLNDWFDENLPVEEPDHNDEEALIFKLFSNINQTLGSDE